jgi:hypothetical protein
LAQVEREMSRVLDLALAGSGDVSVVAEALRVKEREKITLQAKLEHLDGLRQAADAFDPVVWMRDITALLETLPVSFGIAVDPDGARRLLREVLPTLLKVTPDENGVGWTFEAEAQFNKRGLREAAHRIKGQLSVDPLKMVPGA